MLDDDPKLCEQLLSKPSNMKEKMSQAEKQIQDSRSKPEKDATQRQNVDKK